jgi:hypothetical protein
MNGQHIITHDKENRMQQNTFFIQTAIISNLWNEPFRIYDIIRHVNMFQSETHLPTREKRKHIISTVRLFIEWGWVSHQNRHFALTTTGRTTINTMFNIE